VMPVLSSGNGLSVSVQVQGTVTAGETAGLGQAMLTHAGEVGLVRGNTGADALAIAQQQPGIHAEIGFAGFANPSYILVSTPGSPVPSYNVGMQIDALDTTPVVGWTGSVVMEYTVGYAQAPVMTLSTDP
jgi:hypothetical protein